MNPNALAAAIDKARGKASTETSQPTGLTEALGIVRAAATKPPKAAEKAKSVSAKQEGEPLPGLRAWLEKRRNGRR